MTDRPDFLPDDLSDEQVAALQRFARAAPTASKLVVGASARVRPRPIEGQITRVRFDEVTGVRRVTLEWSDDEVHHREFDEDDLEFLDPSAG